MPLFYIHLDNGIGYLEDETGAPYADVDAARERAVNAGAAIIAEELNKGEALVRLTLYVEDADHVRVATIPMTAALK